MALSDYALEMNLWTEGSHEVMTLSGRSSSMRFPSFLRWYEFEVGLSGQHGVAESPATQVSSEAVDVVTYETGFLRCYDLRNHPPETTFRTAGSETAPSAPQLLGPAFLLSEEPVAGALPQLSGDLQEWKIMSFSVAKPFAQSRQMLLRGRRPPTLMYESYRRHRHLTPLHHQRMDPLSQFPPVTLQEFWCAGVGVARG